MFVVHIAEKLKEWRLKNNMSSKLQTKQSDIREKITNIVREWHCRYCDRLKGQAGFHPAHHCETDTEYQTDEIMSLIGQLIGLKTK